MRAADIPSPSAIRRRPSPVLLTLGVLAIVLVAKLGSFTSPATSTAIVAADESWLATLAPSGGDTPMSEPTDAHTARGADTSPTTPATDSSATMRLIDEVLAPSAGTLGVGRPTLGAEPFLEERQALARQQEALQVRQVALQVAEERLRTLLGELESLRAEIDTRLEALDAEDEERMAGLVTLYETMKPKKAALIFNELAFDVLTPLALRIGERKLAPIVAAMDPKVARKLTAELARRRHDESLAEAIAAPTATATN